MHNNQTEKNWLSYLESELPALHALLQTHGYTLDDEQPHIKGERFLMQAVTTTSGQKVILCGRDKTGSKVIIKASRDKAGKNELAHERLCRESLHKINFSYDVFHSAKEVQYIEKDGFTVVITEFIDQTSSFLERPLEEQFSYSLQTFKAQERTRATTFNHIRSIRKTFNYRTSSDYLNLHADFLESVKQLESPESVVNTMSVSNERLIKNKDRIEQYTGFLTHTDFVPHNFRIRDGILYLLDFSSLQFGNKHESWARFLNFMTLHNPELEQLLVTYMEQNRAVEERESLQLMRIFRLGELISYHSKNAQQSEGDLKTLSQKRVLFWTDVLKAELENKRVAREIVGAYQDKRDSLRTEEEKERQVGLH